MVDTDGQHLEKLRTYSKRHHAFPSMAKLCEVVGLSSTASVFGLVSRPRGGGPEDNCPTKGDIVVAVVDRQITVKYLRPQSDGRFYLHAANPAFAGILPAGALEILGVFVARCRSYRR